jgi:hypothetical protein
MASEQLNRTADIANSIEDIHPSLEASSSNPPAPLSKNAQKKAAKTARFAAQKLERRAKEKEAKKAKKRIKAQKRAAGELEEDEMHEEEEKKRMVKRAKTGVGQKPFGARICVDLGFDEMMTDKVGSEMFWVNSRFIYSILCGRKSYHCALNLGTFTVRTDAQHVHSIPFCSLHSMAGHWHDWRG